MSNRRLFLKSLFAIAVAEAAKDLLIPKLMESTIGSKLVAGIDPIDKPGISGNVFRLFLPKGIFHHGDVIAMNGHESQWVYFQYDTDGSVVLKRITNNPSAHQINEFVVDHSDAARNRTVYQEAMLLCNSYQMDNGTILIDNAKLQEDLKRVKYLQS